MSLELIHANIANVSADAIVLLANTLLKEAVLPLQISKLPDEGNSHWHARRLAHARWEAQFRHWHLI